MRLNYSLTHTSSHTALPPSQVTAAVLCCFFQLPLCASAFVCLEETEQLRGGLGPAALTWIPVTQFCGAEVISNFLSLSSRLVLCDVTAGWGVCVGEPNCVAIWRSIIAEARINL